MPRQESFRLILLSLIYQDADGEKHWIDAQGFGGEDGKITCEAHGCKSKIISLK